MVNVESHFSVQGKGQDGVCVSSTNVSFDLFENKKKEDFMLFICSSAVLK
jgi:hypothetical protein